MRGTKHLHTHFMAIPSLRTGMRKGLLAGKLIGLVQISKRPMVIDVDELSIASLGNTYSSTLR